ncbi:MAG: cytochrome c biogenesis protein CcsA [Chitinophagaceae bacterium]|nr:cytochrome c biogenesis protein CcsA [Chitinophagaceae bacterium]MCW5927709.1 cytochrome c biogenesis protein CcsA [Chitinophagaceae bacterium]
MKLSWWKLLCIVLLSYALIGGLLMEVPRKAILNETIRNIYFHVPMWFGMMAVCACSVYHSIAYLRKPGLLSDIRAVSYAEVGILYGALGLITGMIWANYTWGKPWSNDIKQILSAIALLIYAAYFVLRNSITDLDKRARVGAVYNIFAFAMLIPTLYVIPRMMESLHPGGQGNPGADPRDMDSRMHMIFWPAAVPGFIMLGIWISTLSIRFRKISDKNLLHA